MTEMLCLDKPTGGKVQLCVTRNWARRPIVGSQLVRSESGYHFCVLASSLESEAGFA